MDIYRNNSNSKIDYNMRRKINLIAIWIYSSIILVLLGFFIATYSFWYLAACVMFVFSLLLRIGSARLDERTRELTEKIDRLESQL